MSIDEPSILIPTQRVTPYTVFRVGIVSQIGSINILDPLGNSTSGRVRVIFPDRNQMQSWWLYVVNTKSFTDKGWHLPDVNEQVLCLMDTRDEDGAVLGALYSNVDLPPGSTAPSDLRMAPSGASVSGTPLAGSSLDDFFTNGAALCPGLATALPGVSGKNVLKGLAFSESSLNTNAVSEPGNNGSRSWGVMQINTSAHSSYSPDELLSTPELNIRIGEADLCNRYGGGGLSDLQNSVAGYKGFSSYTESAASQSEVDKAISAMLGYGMT